MIYAVLAKHDDKKYRFAYNDLFRARSYFKHNKVKNIRCALLECEHNGSLREDWTLLENFCPNADDAIADDGEFDDYCDPKAEQNWWYL